MKKFFTHNWDLKLIAILLAFTIWWWINDERSKEITIPYSPKTMGKDHEITIQK